MANSTDFRAETVAEEYAELVGRVKAFGAYLETNDSTLVDKKLCVAMLGLERGETKKNEML